MTADGFLPAECSCRVASFRWDAYGTDADGQWWRCLVKECFLYQQQPVFDCVVGRIKSGWAQKAHRGLWASLYYLQRATSLMVQSNVLISGQPCRTLKSALFTEKKPENGSLWAAWKQLFSSPNGRSHSSVVFESAAQTLNQHNKASESKWDSIYISVKSCPLTWGKLVLGVAVVCLLSFRCLCIRAVGISHFNTFMQSFNSKSTTYCVV